LTFPGSNRFVASLHDQKANGSLQEKGKGVGARMLNFWPSKDAASFIAKAPEAPEYDDDGNLTKDGRWVYTWTVGTEGYDPNGA
jgi:hypothetical protein